MNLKINAGVCTHVGKVRSNNEDSFFLNGSCFEGKSGKRGSQRCRESGDSVQLYAVFDGMGGEAAGEEASALGAKLMRGLLEDLRGGEDVKSAVNRYAALANDAVLALKKDAGSTLALLCVKDGVAYAAWLGDSRAYLLRGGELTRLTEDHTEEQRMKSLGIQPSSSRARNSLTRYLGMDLPGLVATPSYAADIPLRRRDVLLLCTDGLTGLVSDKRIAEILERARTPERELVDAALKAGGADNVTVLVVDLIRLVKPLALLGARS